MPRPGIVRKRLLRKTDHAQIGEPLKKYKVFGSRHRPVPGTHGHHRIVEGHLRSPREPLLGRARRRPGTGLSGRTQIRRGRPRGACRCAAGSQRANRRRGPALQRRPPQAGCPGTPVGPERISVIPSSAARASLAVVGHRRQAASLPLKPQHRRRRRGHRHVDAPVLSPDATTAADRVGGRLPVTPHDPRFPRSRGGGGGGNRTCRERL